MSLSSEFVRPEGAGEECLAKVIAEVAGVDVVGRDDNFFELGGDSLAIVQVVAKARTECGVDLSIESFFEEPTVRQLAGKWRGERS